MAKYGIRYDKSGQDYDTSMYKYDKILTHSFSTVIPNRGLYLIAAIKYT